MRVDPSDYIQRWRQLVRARNDQGRRLDRQHGRADFWAGARAERFGRMTVAAQATGSDPLVEVIRPGLTETTTILDVGAGAGRHVILLAPLVARVTAVEPSPAMREQLSIRLSEAGIQNVVVVPGAWPDARVDPADTVICSHVAYFVEEIEPFLRRLREVARTRCFVVVRFQQRELATLDLFERVWGEPRCFEPTFADFFGAAVQIGIWPNVTTIPYLANARFDSLDDAVQTVRADLLNPGLAGVEETIRSYLTERMIVRDGQWVWDLPPASAGVLWWEGPG